MLKKLISTLFLSCGLLLVISCGRKGEESCAVRELPEGHWSYATYMPQCESLCSQGSTVKVSWQKVEQPKNAGPGAMQLNEPICYCCSN